MKELTFDEKIDELTNIKCNEDHIKQLLKIQYSTENLYKDLEIHTRVLNSINNTKTLFGKVTLADRLQTPITNINRLEKRQQLVKSIDVKKIGKELDRLKGLEGEIQWFWSDNAKSENTKSLYEMVYFDFPFLDGFNTNWQILNAVNIYKIILSPVVTILTPIVLVVIPYIISKFMGNQSTFEEFFKTVTKQLNGYGSTSLAIVIWIIMHLQNVYQTYMTAKHAQRVIDILHKKMNVIRRVVDFCGRVGINTGEFSEMFKDDVFNRHPTWIENKGKILATYYKFLDCKDRFVPILQQIGKLDMNYSIAVLGRFTDAKYVTSSKRPKLHFVNMYHPSLSSAVTNTVNLKKNMLITGPNAGGKTTFIRAVAINLLFAQTIGFCCASEATLTPFDKIESYLGIGDTVGKESLFEAQINRCEKYLSSLSSTHYSFIIMDEIFTSTNYIEGFAAAYAILKKMASTKNNRMIVTTHYTDLGKLEEDTGGLIKNYRVTSTRGEDGKITYPYKIERGVSNEKIALEILSNRNFNAEIINDAKLVVASTQSSNMPKISVV